MKNNPQSQLPMWEPGTDDQAEYGKRERLDLQQGWNKMP